jgi:hypothetical protein
MKFIDKNTLLLEKELNELDLFVLVFVNILEKHTRYLIISGYVSLLFGRTRTTEDVDIFIEEVSKEKFIQIYKALRQNYWCLNAEDVDEIYEYLLEGLSIRFAKQHQTVPNFEIKFARKQHDKEALQNPLMVKTARGDLRISSLEQQIAYKKYYLKSDKDLEDAAHLEKIFKEHLDTNKIESYRKIIEHELS